MRVKELIEELKKCNPEAEVHYASDKSYVDGDPAYELYDFIIEKHDRVRSYGSASPRWSYKDNVVVLVYD